MNIPETTSYIETTHDAGRHFVQRDFSGPVVMLNLLRFNDIADYSGHPELGTRHADQRRTGFRSLRPAHAALLAGKRE